MNESVEEWMNGGINRGMNKATGIKCLTFIPNLVTVAGLLGSMTTGFKYSMVTDGSEDGSKFIQRDKNEAIMRSGFHWRQDFH